MVYGPYSAKVARVLDGDTIDLDVDLGFAITYRARIRVYGINAPELSTDEGKRAKLYAEWLLPTGASVQLLSRGFDKYGGRIDGDISRDGTEYARAIVDAGLAVRWDGHGAKP